MQKFQVKVLQATKVYELIKKREHIKNYLC